MNSVALADKWNRFQRWIDERCGTDPNENLQHAIRCRFLVITAWQLAAIITARLIHVWIIVPEVTLPKLITLAGGALFFALPWLLFRTRSVLLTGGLLVGVSFLMIALTIVVTGGLDSSALPFLAIYPLLAGFLMGPRAAIASFIITCAFFASLVGMDGSSLLPNPQYNKSQIHQGLAIANIMAASMAFLIVINYGAIARSAFDRLHTALDKANAANQAKTDFLATMSHELRTPLNGVMGMLGLLIDTPVNKEQRYFAVTARESANSLLNLLNDILDFSRLEAGRITLEDVDFNASQVVDQVRSLLEPSAKEKKLTLTADVDPELPDWLFGDATRLRQVLFNLTDNAIKFTDEGSVTISVRKISGGADHIRVAFGVEDTGIGIKEEDKSRLFERFEQADMSMRRRHGGAGLGLAITRQLVGLMDGQITVDSVPDQGSLFTVIFPFKTGSRAVPVFSAQRPGSKALPSAMRVLLVEDHHINQMLLHTMLTKLGHLVDIASNGQEAVDMVRSAHYHVVLMDIQMPIMDGVQATKTIREMPAPKCNLPIIAVTANALLEQRTAYLEAGMDDFVPKPVDPRRLLEAIHSVLEARDVDPESRKPSAAAEEASQG